jgi:hypothetical protein
MCGTIKNRQTIIISKNLAVSNDWRENLGIAGDFDECIVKNVAHSPLQGTASTSLGSYIVSADFVDSPTQFLCVGTNNAASNPQTVTRVSKSISSGMAQFRIFTRQALDAFAPASTATLTGIMYLTLEFIQYEKK